MLIWSFPEYNIVSKSITLRSLLVLGKHCVEDWCRKRLPPKSTLFVLSTASSLFRSRLKTITTFILCLKICTWSFFIHGRSSRSVQGLQNMPSTTCQVWYVRFGKELPLSGPFHEICYRTNQHGQTNSTQRVSAAKRPVILARDTRTETLSFLITR